MQNGTHAAFLGIMLNELTGNKHTALADTVPFNTAQSVPQIKRLSH